MNLALYKYEKDRIVQLLRTFLYVCIYTTVWYSCYLHLALCKYGMFKIVLYSCFEPV